jgi:hypothetical protein
MSDDSFSPGPVLEAARAYWERLRRGRTMPARGDINPVEVPKPLSCVLLVDVLAQPLDFRFRLVGGDVEAISFRNYRGVRFSEIVHMRPGSEIFGAYRQVVETRRPLWAEVSYVGFDSGIRRIRHILMPLSEDDDRVDTVLGVVDIERGPR